MTLERVGTNEHGTVWSVFDEDGEVVLNGLEYADGSGVLVGSPEGEALDGVDSPEDLLTYATVTL